MDGIYCVFLYTFNGRDSQNPNIVMKMLFKLHCREHCIRIGISIIKVDSFLIL